MRRKAPIIVLVLALAGGAVWYFWPQPEAAPEGTLVLYGNVDVRQVELGFRLGGRLAAMHLEEGDPVTAGTAMAALDTQSFEDEVMLAEAEVGLQEAQQAKVEAGPRPSEIDQARALVAERQSVLDNLEITLERQQRLTASGYASQQNYDDLLAQKREAEARLRSSNEALQLLLEGSREEDIAAAHASLQIAQARLAGAMTSLGDAELIAPDDGMVLTRVEEPGAIVSPGAPVYVLSLRDPVWVRTYVAEPDLGRVFPGMAALVTTDSAPGQPYKGRVGFISPVAEFTPKNVETADLRTDLVYRLRVIVDDPDHGLRQGMPVTVTLRVEETE